MREKLVFGTAALGLAYGLGRDGAPPTMMDGASAARLVDVACARGVTTFDTAPAYGEAEARLGTALGPRGRVWTKVGRHRSVADLAVELTACIERSLVALRRESIELVQWHNWTADLSADAEFRRAWTRLGADHRVRALGATTYGAVDARAAVESGLFSVVQIEWNLLNQGALRAVAAAAREREVRVAVRSVLLQGALTDSDRTVPARPTLAAGIARARAVARARGLRLEELALRAALAQPDIAHVLVGFDRPEQIDDAVRQADASGEPMPPIADLDLGSEASAADPRTW